MHKNLFNNRAFPVLENQQDIAPFLQREDVRAIAFRSPDLTETMKRAASSLADIRSDPQKIAEFLPDINGKRAKYPGETPYYRAITPENIGMEAKSAGIILRPELVIDLADQMNLARSLTDEAYRNLSGDQHTPIVGHILIVPKGIPPRATVPHIDDVELTGHWSSAPLDILTETPDAVMWAALDRRRRDALPPEEQKRVIQWLQENVPEWQENFMYSNAGDVMIMKGQKGRNLRELFHQQQVCAHKSSALLPFTGQIGYVCYHKMPAKPENELQALADLTN